MKVGGGGVSAMTHWDSLDDEHISAIPAVFDLAKSRLLKSALAKGGPVPYGYNISQAIMCFGATRYPPVYRAWNLFVHTPTEGYGHTGVVGVFARNAYPAMSVDNEQFSCRYCEEMMDLDNSKFCHWKHNTR